MTSWLTKLRLAQKMANAGWLREHLSIPLYRNAYLLIINQGLSAGLGILYWMLAARFYTTDQVGKASAIISTLGLLSALAEFSLKSGMQRFIPRAGKHVTRLVVLTYGFILLVTGLLTVAFFFLGSQLNFSDQLMAGLAPTSLMLLVLANMAYTVFIVQDGVLMGLRNTHWVLIENTLYNAAKVALLVVGISGVLGNGIVASWFIPAPIVVLLVSTMIFGRFIPRFMRARQPTDEPLPVRLMVWSVTGDHVGTVLAETSTRLIPLMVINLLGNSANAFFYQAWLIGSMLYLLSSNVAAAFSVESAADPGQIARYSRQTMRQILLIILPLVLVVLVVAHWILSIYGGEYASQGAPLLRWLAVAAIPYGINAWFLSYSRVRADSRSIILVQGVQCVGTLALSYWWMPLYGISSIGLAWLAAQSVNAILVLFRTRAIWFSPLQPAGNALAGQGIPQTGSREALQAQDDPDSTEPYRASSPAQIWEVPHKEGGRPVYLFLSPHLDDAVLSCGGYISRLARAGERVIIATVFTGDLGEGQPTSWLAQRNLRAWGLDEVGTPFSERRLEDLRAASYLGVETLHLGFLDAFYRGRPDGTFYYTRNTVGVPLDTLDLELTGREVQAELRLLAEQYDADGLRVFVTSGIGAHVDHMLLRQSAEAVFDQPMMVYYEEFPYAARYSRRVDARTQLMSAIERRFNGTWVTIRVELTAAEIQARIEASACYTSQIPGLFPTPLGRNLEILSSRTPLISRSLWQLHMRMTQREVSRKRMERIMTRYIRQVGGENYWYLVPAPVYLTRNQEAQGYVEK